MLDSDQTQMTVSRLVQDGGEEVLPPQCEEKPVSPLICSDYSISWASLAIRLVQE